MALPIVYGRLVYAVTFINKKYKIPKKNHLRTGPVVSILARFYDLRATGVSFHSALVHAAAAQKGLGPERKALSRKAIALYAWLTRKHMKQKGLKTPKEFRAFPSHRVGGQVGRTQDPKTGQLGFLK